MEMNASPEGLSDASIMVKYILVTTTDRGLDLTIQHIYFSLHVTPVHRDGRQEFEWNLCPFT